MHVYNKTFQPYIDLTWKPVPNLTIEAGVKDSNFTIDLEAPLNQGTEAPYFTNNTLHQRRAAFRRQLQLHAELVQGGLRAAGQGHRVSDRDRRGECAE